MCKIGVHEFSFGVENFELRGGVFMPFISRPCLDWGREKKINCQKSFNFFSLSLSKPIHFCFVMPNPHTWALEQSVNNVTIISFLIFHV